MDRENFFQALQAEAATFTQAVATDEGDWIIKGFIDVYKHIYTISVDTKVVSKVLELPLFPRFVAKYNLELELSSQQNFYPDITFTSKTNRARFAVDIKSTYRINETTVNGMTLGAFTGYFRSRDSRKMTLYSYNEYAGHFVLGVVYTKNEGFTDERLQYPLAELESIKSVIRDFVFFAQPKYKIAGTRPGSGNTKNIGSVNKTAMLLDGTGPFAQLGEKVYDDYWMYYLTADMARSLEIPQPPYNNLTTYVTYKNRGIDTLKEHEKDILEIESDEAIVAESEQE